MFKFERLEIITIIFLISAFLVWIGMSLYERVRSPIALEVSSYDIDSLKSVGIEDISAGNKEKIDINNAGVAELMKLKGVGKIRAGRIVEYRESKSHFVFPEDIKNVKGIGSALFGKIKDEIAIE